MKWIRTALSRFSFFFFLVVPVVLGFISSSYSNLPKYNYLVQIYGRVMHIINFGFFIFKHSRVFGTLVVHPFSNWMNVCFSFTSVFECFYVWTFISSMSLSWMCCSSIQETCLPHLKYIGEFLLHHQNRVLLCSSSRARLRTTSVE